MSQPRRDELPDHYETLEVSPRASSEVIQAAYRVLARNAHPDRNADGDAEQRIRRINAAYAVLGDPGHRAKYDFECARARRGERMAVGHSAAVVSQAPRRREPAQALAARRSATIRQDRFHIVSPQTFIVVCAVVCLGLVMFAMLWLSIAAALSDDGISVEALPVHTRSIMESYPYDHRGP
ncbi:MAG: J domain-containing protein [Chloroflexi bacterium]|nr:J domain-containing protein [Chloroflexota bacterium]